MSYENNILPIGYVEDGRTELSDDDSWLLEGSGVEIDDLQFIWEALSGLAGHTPKRSVFG